MAKAKTDLVIVESPAKARTIEKYLGSNYQVVASMGHLRDLPKSTMGVDIDGDFTPQYLPVKDRADVIADLKKRAKSAGTVYLATDPDREGEAISWHLKELLNLPDDKAKRVTFNEITKKVVTESIQHPREIDQDLVDAQQARRVLDRIVGYKLSPLLWRKVKPGLSAGRVQSVATRIVVDAKMRSAPSSRRNTGCSTRCLTAARARSVRAFTARPIIRKWTSGRGHGRQDHCRRVRRAVSDRERQARREAAQPLAPVHHLDPAAGGFPPSGYDAAAHHVGRAAAV